MKYSLIIDTSSEYSLVGLATDHQLIQAQIELHANQLGSSLLPTIDALIKQANISIQDLSEIIVGIGPGSYTGTRVGVAVAKALSFGLKIPLRTFCSLLAFLPSFCGSFACVMPSRTGDFFLLKGHQSKTHLETTFSALVSLPELIEALPGVDHILGKPLDEVRQKLGLSHLILPTPGLSTPLLYIASSQGALTKDSGDLIYLHQP